MTGSSFSPTFVMLRFSHGNPQPHREGAPRFKQGIVSGLQRTAEMDGGVSTGVSNYHVCIFNLGADRAQLGGWSPPPIADGDVLRAVGRQDQGVLDIIACHDLTTGWRTPRPVRSWLQGPSLLIIFFAIIAGLLAYIFIGWFALLLPVAGLAWSIYIAGQPTEAELAWDLLMDDPPAAGTPARST